MTDYIYGLRAIIEAIDAGKEVDKIFLKKDLSGDIASELFDRVKQLRIPVQRVPVERLKRITSL